jgi:small subunit ribosomal protein S6
MRRYESVVILDPELPEEDIQNFTEKYSQAIKQNGGEVIKIEDWGFKKLAYLVKKRERGRYLLLDYVGLPALLSELERQFKISEEVMKFVSVKIDDNVDLEAFKAQTVQEEETAAEPTDVSEVEAATEPAPDVGEAEKPEEPEEEAPQEVSAATGDESPKDVEADASAPAPSTTQTDSDEQRAGLEQKSQGEE